MARILVVEDDDNLRDMIREWLVFEKHTVVTCSSGLEALEQLEMVPFDATLLDWHLTDLSGLEVLQKYRQGGGTCPILILTGSTTQAEKQEALAAGADYFVTKPFKLMELSRSIEKMAAQKQ